MIPLRFALWIALIAAWAGGLPSSGQAFSVEVPNDIRIGPASLTTSRQDMLCLALNDYWEARGETLMGRVAVAQVVLNRAQDPRYPNTICDVVQENRSGRIHGCQFSWYCDGRSDAPVNAAAWRSSVLMALSILRRDNAIADPTDGALWYHNSSVRPGWAGKVRHTVKIGRHLFYADPAPRLEEPQTAER